MGYDHIENKYFQIDFDEIPVRFPGTGDIFSAIFMANILNGETLQTATHKDNECRTDNDYEKCGECR